MKITSLLQIISRWFCCFSCHYWHFASSGSIFLPKKFLIQRPMPLLWSKCICWCNLKQVMFILSCVMVSLQDSAKTLSHGWQGCVLVVSERQRHPPLVPGHPLNSWECYYLIENILVNAWPTWVLLPQDKELKENIVASICLLWPLSAFCLCKQKAW